MKYVYVAATGGLLLEGEKQILGEQPNLPLASRPMPHV
jgi:hypothetical protein